MNYRDYTFFMYSWFIIFQILVYIFKHKYERTSLSVITLYYIIYNIYIYILHDTIYVYKL
jgi:hypothetical protein